MSTHARMLPAPATAPSGPEAARRGARASVEQAKRSFAWTIDPLEPELFPPPPIEGLSAQSYSVHPPDHDDGSVRAPAAPSAPGHAIMRRGADERVARAPAPSPARAALGHAIMRKCAEQGRAISDPGAAFARATASAGASVPFRSRMEHAFGHDFSGVQAHLGQDDPMRALGAHAATQGETIAFASPSPDAETVAHELAHVVQNRQAAGAGAVQTRSAVSAPEDAAEREARDVEKDAAMGREVHVHAAPGGLVQRDSAATPPAPAQPDPTPSGSTPPADTSPSHTPPDPDADFKTAMDLHRKDLSKLSQILKTCKGDPKPPSPWGETWPNACEWVQSGKIQLHALTSTHDAQARAVALKGPDTDKWATFGIDHAWPADSGYDKDDKKNKDNIFLATPSQLGVQQDGPPPKIGIVDPFLASDDNKIKEVIVHEVQHDADHSKVTDQGGAWSRYATEFRAYWIDESYRNWLEVSGAPIKGLNVQDPDGKNSVNLDGFDNMRQQKIFEHLYSSKLYMFVSQAWNSDDGFKAKVLAMKQPEGINLVDSVRIDDLYLELSKSKPDKAKVTALVTKLNDKDKAAIQDPGMKPRWTALIDDKIKGDDGVKLKQSLGI